MDNAVRKLYEKYRETEKRQRVYLKYDKALVIRFDGKNVTKDHARYHLIPEGEWRKPIFDAAVLFACEAAGGYGRGEIRVFSVLDEVSIVFSSAGDALSGFDEPNAVYAAGMFVQMFTRHLRKIKGESPDFGVSVFNIEEEDVPEYLSLRKALGRHTAIDYIAKEYKTADRTAAEVKAEETEKSEPGFLNGIETVVSIESENVFFSF